MVCAAKKVASSSLIALPMSQVHYRRSLGGRFIVESVVDALVCSHLFRIRPHEAVRSSWKSPWFGTDDFAFGVRPEVDTAADEIVQSWIGGLVEKDGCKTGKRKPEEAQFQGSLYGCSSEQIEWKFVGKTDETNDEVDSLEDGHRFDCAVKVLGHEIEEHLGPEEAFDTGHDLIWRYSKSSVGSHASTEARYLHAAAVMTIRRAQ